METRQHGAKGQEVLDLQCALAAAGVFAGDLDGCFGPGTEVAVKAFQSKQGLVVCGLVNEQTASALGFRNATEPVSRVPGVTPEMVAQIFPGARLADIRCNLPHVLNALADTDTVNESVMNRELIAMALATIRTETSQFLPVSEMQSALNTSVGGKPFDLYDHRTVVGNTGAPDGAHFRGRGFVQLTGRANYLQSGQAVGMGTRLVSNPLLAHDPATAGKLLANFLKKREVRLQSALGKGDLTAARRVVNGGNTGIQPFSSAYEACLALLPKELVKLPAQQAA